MVFSAAQIAGLVNGIVEGNAQVTVSNVAKIEEAKKGDLAFLANPKYEEFLYNTQASIVLLNKDFTLQHSLTSTIIRVSDAYAAFAKLLSTYQQMQEQNLVGVQEPVHIANTASIGDNCFIAAFTYISNKAVIGNNVKLYAGVYIGDNVVVDDNCILHPGVKIYHGCVIGKNVVIHAGTVIGSDGFGFAPQADGTFGKIPQIGNVVIEDNVEIGANTTIDRATMGSTLIKKGTKLDNLIQIAHNVEVGSNTVIAAQAGVSGSTKIGNGVMMGGQAGIVGHLQIADGTRINAQSGIIKTIKQPNTAVTGTPAFDYTAAVKSQAVARNLPDMEKRIKSLEMQVKQLLELNPTNK
ncbi:MAG: UDP-3-O-(3-hydroxymyristoyl)glucosamine N-acyltransferase [Chitinophagaceae bacterium]